MNLLNGRNILIVEDEMLVLMMLETILEGSGCTVVAAGHVDEATVMATDLSIDAAVIDVNLHGRRSYPVADALNGRAIPFAFSTGYGDAELAKLYPGRPVLTKPFTPEDLIATLTTLIGNAETGRCAP